MVVTPPATHLIQRPQEQIRPLHLLQHRLATGPAGDRIAQPAGQAPENGGLQEKPAHLLRLMLEHLPGRIIQDITMAAAEGGHNPAGSACPRSDRPASCSPAAHPSVRAASAATAAAGRSPPIAARSSAAASSALKGRSSARSSAS